MQKLRSNKISNTFVPWGNLSYFSPRDMIVPKGKKGSNCSLGQFKLLLLKGHLLLLRDMICRNPTLAKCEDETHTPKVGDLESSGTPEPLELDSRGQNTLHWGVLYISGKFLKCRCPKWPRMSHLDICSPSYGQKNW
jgi:hypothetical protein